MSGADVASGIISVGVMVMVGVWGMVGMVGMAVTPSRVGEQADNPTVKMSMNVKIIFDIVWCFFMWGIVPYLSDQNL